MIAGVAATHFFPPSPAAAAALAASLAEAQAARARALVVGMPPPVAPPLRTDLVASSAAGVAAPASVALTTDAPAVLFVSPAACASGHAAGVEASFAPPVATTAPPPSAGTSDAVPAPLLAAGVGASSAPPVATAAPPSPASTSAAFLRGTLPVPVASRDPRPQAPPVAMFVVASPPFAPPSSPPTLPSHHPTWPGEWAPANMAQTFSITGATPPFHTEWIADSGASFHTIPDARILFYVRPLTPLILLRSWLVMGPVSLSPPWVLL
jgi:hypothetical protein